MKYSVTPRSTFAFLWQEHPRRKKIYLSIQLPDLNQEINIRLLQGECCDDHSVLLSDRCQEIEAGADTHHLASQTETHPDWGCPHSPAVSLAETGLLSTRTGLSLARAALSIINALEGFSPFIQEKLGWVMWNMPVRKGVFITQPSNIYNAFLFLLGSLTKVHYVNKLWLAWWHRDL